MTDPLQILQTRFGYDSFRPNQKEIIQAVIKGKDVFASMPTGGGKSICYQLPALVLDGYMEKLKELPVRFFAVDEAHCLSEWGHDFRPDYLSLAGIRKAFPGIPIAAFTATATQKVQDDIIRILKLDNPFQVRPSFNRKELFYRVDRKEKVLPQITRFIKDQEGQAGIVYRTSRKDVEKTAAHLCEKGIKAPPTMRDSPRL